MSLFDILKYGNTDLSSRSELEKLPAELLKLYWINSISPYVDIESKTYPVDARMLAGWHDESVYRDDQIDAFKKALKEYNNESL